MYLYIANYAYTKYSHLRLNRWSLGKPENESFFVLPVLHFLFIVVWPKITEFRVPWTVWYVGLLFCPLAPRSWLKWFSTTSWLTIAGLISDPGKWANFDFTMEIKPKTIDCKSNQVFSDKNSLGEDVLDFHLAKYCRACCNFKRRMSFTWEIACLSEKSSTIALVCDRNVIVASNLSESLPLALEFRWSL